MTAFQKDNSNPALLEQVFFKIWDSLHARLNSHYQAWSYKKDKHKKDRLVQKEKVDFDGEKSAQKDCNTKMTPSYGYGARTNCTLQLFCCFFVIMFILCYWYDKKTGIDIYWSLKFYLRLNLGMPKLVCPKSVNRFWKQSVSISERLQHIGNQFRKSLQLKEVC